MNVGAKIERDLLDSLATNQFVIFVLVPGLFSAYHAYVGTKQLFI